MQQIIAMATNNSSKHVSVVTLMGEEHFETNAWITLYTDYQPYLFFGGKSAVFCSAVFYKSIGRLVTVFWNFYCRSHIVLSSGERRAIGIVFP